MMANNTIAGSELPITAEGRIYHLNLQPDELADTVLTVGDPDRVERVSHYFDDIECKAQHREFITHTGYYNGKRLSVLSTGIGTPNIDIVLNELDALVNIDFDNKTVRSPLRALRIVRLGTSGSLQESVPVGTLVTSSSAIGLDGLLHYYQLSSTDYEIGLKEALEQHFAATPLPLRPYVIAADPELLDLLSPVTVPGITVTCPGFYGPQSRKLRGDVFMPNLMDQLASFRYQQNFIANFEMETSAIYGMSRLLGHQHCSVSAVIANRVTGEFCHGFEKVVDHMIEQVLNQLTK